MGIKLLCFASVIFRGTPYQHFVNQAKSYGTPNKSPFTSTAISNGGVASSVESETYTGVHSITHSRYFFQVTALALHTLVEKAYLQYLEFDVNDEQPLSKKKWIIRQKSKEPQFLYWYQGLEYILLAIQYVRTLRVRLFHSHLETLEKFLPLIHAMDHHHYARALPIYLRDMCTSTSGCWTRVSKTCGAV